MKDEVKPEEGWGGGTVNGVTFPTFSECVYIGYLGEFARMFWAMDRTTAMSMFAPGQ